MNYPIETVGAPKVTGYLGTPTIAAIGLYLKKKIGGGH